MEEENMAIRVNVPEENMGGENIAEANVLWVNMEGENIAEINITWVNVAKINANVTKSKIGVYDEQSLLQENNLAGTNSQKENK